MSTVIETKDTGILTILPILPVKNTVLFPNLFLPLSVGRAGSIASSSTRSLKASQLSSRLMNWSEVILYRGVSV